jgi:hypothetical protein
VLVIIVPFVSEGAEWIRYATTESGGQCYLDKESITHASERLVRVWDKSMYDRPQKIQSLSYHELLRYVELDCNEKRLRVLEATYFLVGGNTVSTNNKYREEWFYIQSEETNNTLLEILCKDKYILN